MPAKPLTQEQKEDAKRLKDAFTAWKKRQLKQGLPGTQDAAGDALGFGQSAMNQYLNGKIPLNAEVLTKISSLFEVSPRSISPSIVDAQLKKSFRWVNIESGDGVTIEQKVSKYRSGVLPDDLQEALFLLSQTSKETRAVALRAIRAMAQPDKNMVEITDPMVITDANFTEQPPNDENAPMLEAISIGKTSRKNKGDFNATQPSNYFPAPAPGAGPATRRTGGRRLRRPPEEG